MAEVARAAGVSRQTLYNEFDSRQGVAQQYILRLVDQFIDEVREAVAAHPGDARGAVVSAFERFIGIATNDPAVRWALLGRAKSELLSLITTDGWPVLEKAVTSLAEVFENSWVQLSPGDARIAANHVGRIALSFIAIPARSPDTIIDDFTSFVVPFFERAYEASLARRQAS